MMATRHDMHGPGAMAMIGLLALVAFAALVLMLARHGLVAVFGTPGAMLSPAIPGVTIDDSGSDRMPVVTSLRTHSEAERRGVRVGDLIRAVDGRQVRDVAALRDAVAKHSGAVPVSLKIQRGDISWEVALDRSEPAADMTDRAAAAHDPENPSRRGR